jgi:hypothetical protein
LGLEAVASNLKSPEATLLKGAQLPDLKPPQVAVSPPVTRITAKNVLQVLDMETRFILNEACFKKGVPFIHGGVRGLMGEVTTIIPGETPCLECLFPRGPEKEEPFPVFGATAALIAGHRSN